jgi:hypothetical protein
MCLPVELLALL